MFNKQWEKDIEMVAKYYTDKISEKGYSFETLAAREQKYTNMFFDELFTGIEIKNDSSFLDIGSGLGLFIDYLNSRNINSTKYLGIDLIEEFINYSKLTYPDYKFLRENFISSEFSSTEKYDYVFALGVLVSRVSEYEMYISEFIKKMIFHSKEYVLLNLVTEIDYDSQNYSNKEEIGGITSISKSKLEEILNSIQDISYKIIEKRIFDDATDAFIQIKLNKNEF